MQPDILLPAQVTEFGQGIDRTRIHRTCVGYHRNGSTSRRLIPSKSFAQSCHIEAHAIPRLAAASVHADPLDGTDHHTLLADHSGLADHLGLAGPA